MAGAGAVAGAEQRDKGGAGVENKKFRLRLNNRAGIRTLAPGAVRSPKFGAAVSSSMLSNRISLLA